MRLIDADFVKQRIDETMSSDYVYSTRSIKNLIDEAPTIDAEPVIRCKDCVFYWYQKLKQDGTPDKRYNPSYCYYWGKGRTPNEYCSRAMDRVSLDNAIKEMAEENERKRK